MFNVLDKSVMGMAFLRIISGLIEVSVAIAILRLNDVSKALVLNSALALVGPCVLILTTAIGLVGIAEKLSLLRIFVIFSGVGLILLGIRLK